MVYFVDYNATMIIEAENEDEAREIFYQVYCDETRQLAEVTCVESEEEYLSRIEEEYKNKC